MKDNENGSRSLMLLVLAAVIVGGGIYMFSASSETVEDVEISEVVVSVLDENSKYENKEYQFSMVLPDSWGDVTEDISVGPALKKISRNIRLTSKSDRSRYIQIQVVRTVDKDDPAVVDHPHTYIAGNSVWSFYYSGGGDYAGMPGLEDQKYVDIQNEVNQIISTFELY